MKFTVTKKKLPVEGPVLQGKLGNAEIYILGTAHVSRQSVIDTEKLIEKINPDSVGVELCESRFQSFMDREAWKKLDIVQVLKERKIYLLFSSVVLSVFQKKMGEQLQTKPGEEMMRAVELAQSGGRALHLIDRSISITLRRAWQSLGYFSRVSVISEMVGSLFYKGDLDKEEIERMKTKDVFEDLIESLPPQFSGIRKILIDERDMYLAQKIRDAVRDAKKGGKFVAVVGAGHLPGIEKNLEAENNLEILDSLRKPNKWVAAASLLLPIAIIITLVLYFSGKNPDHTLFDNIVLWVAVKSVASALFPLLMLAHPVAILGAALSGPVSNFNPVIKPGWVSALAEAHFRRPLVEDFENMVRDTSSLRSVFRNRVFRVFLLFFLSQFGAFIGMFVALYWMGVR